MGEYKELETYSKNLGLDFIVSCWDLSSVDDIENNLNVKYHKEIGRASCRERV